MNSPHVSAGPDYGYLQHGKQPGPFRTERVTVRNLHGDVWQAFYEGSWRAVYIKVRRLYIRHEGINITIIIEGV